MSETNPILALTEEFSRLQYENNEFRESLSQVQAMLQHEDQGWKRLIGGGFGDKPGPDLEDTKENALMCREMAAGSALIKRGLTLRYGYVWGKGVNIPGVEQTPGKRGPKSSMERFYHNHINQSSIFGESAKQGMEFSLGTDGCFLLLGDNRTKELRAFPVSEVAAILTNPDFTGEIWAIQREWDSYDSQGKSTVMKRWYYLDTFTGVRKKSYGESTERVVVDSDKTLFDIWANRQVGWPIGVPDALPAIAWARRYTELMEYGRIQTEALAKFAFKAKVGSQAGSNNVGAKIATISGAGNVATLGPNNDLVPMPSATSVFTFEDLRPVAAQAATALEVSIVHLLSDPSASGSSYSAGEQLTGPQQKAMRSRQNLWKSFLERVIKWGTGEDVTVAFPDIENPDPYRDTQVVTQAWNSGLFHKDEIRARFIGSAGIEPLHADSPDGVLLPNNLESLARKDIDTDSSSSVSTDPPAVTPTAPNPNQGKADGTGGVGSTDSNDLRDDNIS